MATWYKGERPSGAVLPLRLRRKLQEQQSELSEGHDDRRTQVPPDPCVLQHPGGSAVANRVFSAEELVDHIRRTSMAMVDIHKQLLRGEELYHEETNSHGNLFKGWDMFIDSKDVGSLSTGSSTAHPNSGNRRMPTTDRWFSGSCQSIFKTARITPLSTSRRNTPATTATITTSTTSSAAPLKPPPPITIPSRPPPDPPATAVAETKTNVVDPVITKESAIAPTALVDEQMQLPPQEIAVKETPDSKDSPRLPADDAKGEQMPITEVLPDSNQIEEIKPIAAVPPVSDPPVTEEKMEAMDDVVLEAKAETTPPEASNKKSPTGDSSPMKVETNPEPQATPPPLAPPQQSSSQGSKKKEKGKSQPPAKRLKRKR